MEFWRAILKDAPIYITGLGALIGASVYCYRKGLKPMFQAVKNYQDLCQKVDKIFFELSPNGGKSIKDTIHKIDERLVLFGERQRAIVAEAPVAYFDADPHGNFIWVNRTYLRMVERTASEVLGQGWQNTIHPDDRELFIAAWNNAIKQDREFSEYVRFMTPSGRSIKVRCRSYKMTGSHGDTIGFLGHIVEEDSEYTEKNGVYLET